MDSFVTERDFELLRQDRYTFAVLARILRGECRLIRSDHERLILCHSAARYPVWLWTADGASNAEKEEAWRLVSECRPFSGGFRILMKEETAEYFLFRAERAGGKLRVCQRLCAFDCPAPVEPSVRADGELYVCTENDLAEILRMKELFCRDTGEPSSPPEESAEKALERINERAFLFWKNAAGKTVACCAYRFNDGLVSINTVYTLPEERRKHYAQNLVYEATLRAAASGCTPSLYTDAGYAPSNACYMKIGYIPRGSVYMLSSAGNIPAFDEPGTQPS